MKKIAGVIVALLLVASGSPGATAGPGTYGVTSDNVEHVKFVPFEIGTATGAKVVGKYLYVTSWKSMSIYDISNPLEPKEVSRTIFGFRFENENVTTNGKIMLFSEQLPNDSLHVYDVRDKANPTEIAVLQGGGSHTATCILDCKYSYGTYDFVGPEGATSGATLVDLRDPKNPKELGHWNAKLKVDKIHDVTEVAPGRVLAASMPLVYLDVRGNPLRPKPLAYGANLQKREHSAVWPREGKDRFMLSVYETNGTPRCEAGVGAFSVWDTRYWRQTKDFRLVDEWYITNGTYTDGRPITSGPLGCSPHWFQEHPTFDNGGIVAIGYYDHGTRFLRVSDEGKISEEGYFLPWRGSTSAAYWVTDRIVYSIDYERGLDILRYTGKF